jgi:type IV secretory pathway TraG/TraD family ATPase VirD4
VSWFKTASGGERHRRGTRIIGSPYKGWSRWWRAGTPSGGLTLAGLRIAALDETKHYKMIGTTGTGKSTAISELLSGALRRGDRAVISDPDGGYLARFGNRHRGDVVLNPFEPETMRWDVFAELRHSYDAEQLAAALIVSSADPAAQEWRAYARTFVTALLRRCQRQSRPQASELWRLLAVASGDELRAAVDGTPAQPFLEPDNARMLGSIRSVAVSAMAAFEYIQAQRSSPLGIRNWVRSGRGTLFIPYRAAQIASLRSVIAAWLRLAIFEVLNGEAGVDQRIWFVVDELDALGAIDGLRDALARLRKFGGRCVLGFQSLAQVSGTYGHSDAQTLIENCGNTLILRCSASEQGGTSQFAARLIGEREVLRQQRSRASDRDGVLGWRLARSSRQISEQQVIESAVLASEIEQLSDLHGYLKLASSPVWVRVRLRPQPSV